MHKFLPYSIALTFFPFFFIACVTASTDQNFRKLYESCICGPTLDANNQAQCAIWGASKNLNQAQTVWQSESQTKCEAEECSQLFSKFCHKIQMWPHPVISTKVLPQGQECYCDQLLFENDRGQVQLFCAAWSGPDKNVLEYYNLDDCNPMRCLAPPFHSAPILCGKRFKGFYPPMTHYE